MKISKKTKGKIVAGLIAIVLSTGISGCGEIPQRLYPRPDSLVERLPSDERLQEGYVNVRKIEVQIRDDDNNGKYETVLIYEGQKYSMKYDEQSKRASLVPYSVKIVEQE